MTLALPSGGVGGGFPKLEFLRIMPYHLDFLARDIDSMEREGLGAIVDDPRDFLRLEGHSTFNVVDIGVWGMADVPQECRRTSLHCHSPWKSLG